MNKKYQIFISSTFTDLQNERKKVINTILKLDCIPAGMEAFVATDDEQFSVIKKVIDLCDYYLLIIGNRYGSISDSTHKSYTEMEYDYALSKKMTVLVFAQDLTNVKLDNGESPESQEKLKAFRNKALKNRMATIWRNTEDLCTDVAISIPKAINTYPAIGWIRTDEISNELSNEYEKMEDKIFSLEKELQSYKSQSSSIVPLSNEAKMILLQATTPSANGEIIVTTTLEGKLFQAGCNTLCSSSNNRLISIWDNAIKQLLSNNYITSLESKNELFKVSHEGYAYSDKLHRSNFLENTDINMLDTNVSIFEYISSHPEFSLAEISSFLNISNASAKKRLDYLQSKNYIKSIGTARTKKWVLNIPTISGNISFDYSNNNGIIIIGNEPWIFHTKWSKGSNEIIHAYSDCDNISHIARIKVPKTLDLITEKDIINLDYTSRCRDASIGDIIVWQNTSNHILLTQINRIQDDSRGYDNDSLDFEYRILK